MFIKQKREIHFCNLPLMFLSKIHFTLRLDRYLRGLKGVHHMRYYTKKIEVKSPFLTGWRKFNYDKPTPFVGVADYKLNKIANNEVTLEYETPQRVLTITPPMIYESLLHGYVEKRKKVSIIYFPLDIFSQ